MPSIREMFPRRYLDKEDFKPGELQVVTIKTVVMEQAKARFNPFAQAAQPGWNAQPQAQPEVDWLMFFYEFQKPMRLRISKAKVIAVLLGTDKTEAWIDKRIGFYRGPMTIGGEVIDTLLIDTRLPSPSPERQLAAPIDKSKVIPAAAVTRFLESAKAKGKAWDDFLAWSKDADRQLHDAMVGEQLDRIPAAAVGPMKKYLDVLYGAMPAPQLDVSTAQPPPVEIPEDDIPF